MQPKTCFSIFYISAYISILALVFPFAEGPTLFLIMSGLQMLCCSAWKMTEGQAKIINFNDISTPSLSCVIPVYAAAINLCLSKRVCARALNVDRAEEANLLRFDKVWPHLAIQGGWVPLVNCASIFSDPNCSISFQDPLHAVSVHPGLSYNRMLSVSYNFISIGFQYAQWWVYTHAGRIIHSEVTLQTVWDSSLAMAPLVSLG